MSLNHRKTILRKIPNGLFIVTAKEEESGTGAVISFATQTSIDPLYIALAIRKDSNLFKVAYESETLAVNFPSNKQQDMVASFFKVKERTKNTINGYEYEWSNLGNPILKDVPMYLEVKIIEIVEKGDHPLFICEVVNTVLKDDTDILTIPDTNWHYGG